MPNGHHLVARLSWHAFLEGGRENASVLGSFLALPQSAPTQRAIAEVLCAGRATASTPSAGKGGPFTALERGGLLQRPSATTVITGAERSVPEEAFTLPSAALVGLLVRRPATQVRRKASGASGLTKV